MIKRDIKRYVSRLRIDDEVWVYLPVSKTIDQKKREKIILSSISIGVIIAVFSSLHLFLNFNYYGKSVLQPNLTNQAELNFFYLNVLKLFVLMHLIILTLWMYFHSSYSKIKNWRLIRLLERATSELDLLRHHHVNQTEEPVRTIEWQFIYKKDGTLKVRLLPGGHITKDKSEDIARQLTYYLIKETKDDKEWYLVDSFIDDETGTVNILYGPKRKRISIDSINSINNNMGLIQLDSEFYFEPRKQVHLIAVGRTGSGKTYFLKILILSILKNHKNKLYICDGKSSYLSTLKHSNKNISVSTNGEDLLEMLVEISSVIDNRYKKLNEKTYEEKDLTYLDVYTDDGKIYFVFDEILSLFSRIEIEDKLLKPKERLLPLIQKEFTNILQLGRAANVHVILSGQQIPATILPTSSREAFGARVLLGKVDPSNAIEIFNLGKGTLPKVDTSNYGALIYLDGFGWDLPKSMLLPYLDEDKLPFKKTLRELQNNNL